MKKKYWIVVPLILLLCVLCVIFWQAKEAEHRKLEDFCQSSVSIATEEFRQYKTSGANSDYINGVAHFRCFMNGYLFLNDNVSDTNYIWCNTLYGEMILSPEAVQTNVDILIEALEILDSNYNHPEGYNKINALINILTREEL